MNTKKQRNEAKIYSLTEYKDKYHRGRKGNLARFFGRLPQDATKMFGNESIWCISVQGTKHSLQHIKCVKYLDIST